MKLNTAMLEALVTGEAFMVDGTTTICILSIGKFKLIGKSACIDAATFNAEIGKKIARDDAINRLWELEGYAQVRLESLMQQYYNDGYLDGSAEAKGVSHVR